MKIVSIHDAQANLSKYIAAAKRGEDIYIGNHGKPEVKLGAVEISPKPQRKLGILQGKVSQASLDYDKHSDPEWQHMVKGMYNKRVGGN